jgi:type II secretory pathway pseudopilin PulG
MKKSFTLIEILVVTTIIVLLTATAVVSYSSFLKQSRDARRKADLSQIAAALEMYRSNNDFYINGDWSSLSALTSGTVYIQSLPSDPKSTSYSYYYSGSDSDYTLGAYLEGAGTTCVADQCGGNCKYCLGPYGQK